MKIIVIILAMVCQISIATEKVVGPVMLVERTFSPRFDDCEVHSGSIIQGALCQVKLSTALEFDRLVKGANHAGNYSVPAYNKTYQLYFNTTVDGYVVRCNFTPGKNACKSGDHDFSIAMRAFFQAHPEFQQLTVFVQTVKQN